MIFISLLELYISIGSKKNRLLDITIFRLRAKEFRDTV